MKLTFPQDLLLQKVVKEIDLPVLTSSQNIYKALLSSIISQQLSVKAAATIYQRFLQLFENNTPTPESVLATDTATLRSIGLSQQKAGYVQNVARFAIEHPLDADKINELTDEQIINQLTQIKGVGKWTVEMILIFTLARPDVFPMDDLGIQQAMIKLYNLEERGKLLKPKLISIAEVWKPHRSLACRYLWKWKDSKP